MPNTVLTAKLTQIGMDFTQAITTAVQDHLHWQIDTATQASSSYEAMTSPEARTEAFHLLRSRLPHIHSSLANRLLDKSISSCSKELHQFSNICKGTAANLPSWAVPPQTFQNSVSKVSSHRERISAVNKTVSAVPATPFMGENATSSNGQFLSENQQMGSFTSRPLSDTNFMLDHIASNPSSYHYEVRDNSFHTSSTVRKATEAILAPSPVVPIRLDMGSFTTITDPSYSSPWDTSTVSDIVFETSTSHATRQNVCEPNVFDTGSATITDPNDTSNLTLTSDGQGTSHVFPTSQDVLAMFGPITNEDKLLASQLSYKQKLTLYRDTPTRYIRLVAAGLIKPAPARGLLCIEHQRWFC
jgi:hypothetical protein